MRLSTSWMYQQSLGTMMNQQSALAASQNQVSTGRRINVASDDPAGAGRMVSLNHILAANTQYTANIDAANTRLNTSQSTLNAVNGLYDSARLAQRLGVSPVSLRTARHRGVDWLPAPAGELNGGPVWTAESLEGIEDRRRGAGRPRRQG